MLVVSRHNIVNDHYVQMFHYIAQDIYHVVSPDITRNVLEIGNFTVECHKHIWHTQDHYIYVVITCLSNDYG